MATNGIRRTGPPQAVQVIRDGVFMVQVGISGSPSADWRRLFYDAQQEVPPDFRAAVGGNLRDVSTIQSRPSYG